MENTNHVSSQVFQAFGCNDFYEVLKIPKDSSVDDIKKAYRKLALIHHPDKGGDAEKFKALSVIHATLSDPEKRNIYDSCGSVDDSDYSEEFDHWYDYFRSLFPQVTVSSIEKFSNEYKGSSEEYNDIINSYNTGGGDFYYIMESVMLAEAEDEERILTLVENAISANQLQSTPIFEKSKKKVINSIKKGKRAVHRQGEEIISEGNKINAKPTLKKNKPTKEVDENLFQSILANRQRSSASVLDSIMKKYGGDDFQDIPDDEFNQLRSNLTNNKQKNSSKKTKKTNK